MATRWSLSKGPAVIPSAARNRTHPGKGAPRPRRWRFLATLGMTRPLGVTVLLLACVSTVTRYYLPDAKNPRFDTEQAVRMLDQYVRIQCPERLAAKKPESGDARLTIRTDTSGAVTQAEL